MPVVEDIIFPADLDERSVGVARIVLGMPGIRGVSQTDVAAGYQDAAVLKALHRALACGITEVVAVEGAVDEVIGISELPHGAGFAEGLGLIGRALCLLSRQDAYVGGAGQDRLHIGGIDLIDHGAVLGGLGTIQQDGISPKGKAHIKVEPSVVILEDGGIELEGLVLLADGGAVLIGYVTVEFILAGGLVAHGDGDHLGAAHEIKQIEPAVGALDHVGGRKAVGDLEPGGRRILLSLIDFTFIAPVAQIVHRSGPAYIVAQTEVDAVEKVVGPVYIDPAVYDMGLRVRNILPAGHVGIDCLPCLHK